MSAWQLDQKGNSYFFVRSSRIVKGLSARNPVGVGQQIGSVGNTGDARGGVHHLHLETQTGDCASNNPYPKLQAFAPAVDAVRASPSRNAS